jgi:membrane fusion protein
MTQELFRREALEARRTHWLGGISLAQPLRLWLLTAVALLAAVTVALYLLVGSYTRRTTVVGQLVPVQGLATVLAPSAGVVSELHAEEGSDIVAGQTLAVVTVPRVTISSAGSRDMETSLGERRAGLESVLDGQMRALAAQAGGLAAQLATARNELQQIEGEIATRQQQVHISETTLARLRELHQYVSQLQLGQQETVLLEQVAAVQALQRQAGAAERNIQQLQQSLDELPGQRSALEASVQRDLAALAQERVEMNASASVTIAAPVNGIVATQIVKTGQAVQEGQPLLTLLPGDGTLEAELLVPSRAIGFIAPGDHVLLRYQAFPWQKFGHQQGTVASISRSALDLARADQPLYRVTVTLMRQSVMAYGQAESLKPGMVLDADILGERRRLIEWLFEPLYSLKGRVASG